MLNKLHFGMKLVAVFIILTFFTYGFYYTFITMQVLFQYPLNSLWQFYLIANAVVFIMLNLLSFYLLYSLKPYAFEVAYLTIIYSTFVYSAVYLPFISDVLYKVFTMHQVYSLLLINCIIILYLAYLQSLSQKVKAIK